MIRRPDAGDVLVVTRLTPRPPPQAPIEVRKATFASLLRLASRYVSGGSKAWLKFKNPAAPAVKRETEED